MEYRDIHVDLNENPDTLLKFSSLNSEVKYLETLKSDPEALEETMVFGDQLIESAESSNISRLSRLLETPHRPPILCWHIVKIVQEAIENYSTEAIQCLVDHNLDMSHPGFKGFLPSVVAKYKGEPEAMRKLCDLLISAGIHADDSEAASGCTAMHIACVQLDLEAVKYLISKGANVNAINMHNQMPLNLVEGNEGEDAQLIAQTLRENKAERQWNSYMRHLK